MCCIIDCKLYDLVLKFFGFAKPQMVNIKTRKIMKTISDPDSDSVRVRVRIPISVLSSNEPLARLQFKMFLKIVCPLFFSFLFAFLMFFVFFFFLAFSIENRSTVQSFNRSSYYILHIV